MRKLILTLLAMSCLPAAAAAQAPLEPAPRQRLALTAYTGVRAPFTTGSFLVFNSLGQRLFSARQQRGGNPVLGLEGKLRVAGRFSLVAGGTYSTGGGTDLFLDRDPGFGEPPSLSGTVLSDVWFARAGVSARFAGGTREDGRRLPSTDITVAPALVRELDTSHPALNFGFEGTLPVAGRGLEFVLGLEDYLVFWDRDALNPQLATVVNDVEALGLFGQTIAVETRYRNSNVLLLRIGVSLRH